LHIATGCIAVFFFFHTVKIVLTGWIAGMAVTDCT